MTCPKINGTPRKSWQPPLQSKSSSFFCKVLFAAQELRQNQKFSLNIRSPTTTPYNHMAEKIESMWRINYYRFRQSEKTSLFHSTITLLFLQVWLLWLSAQYFLKRNCSILCSCLPQTQFLSTHHCPGHSNPLACMNSVLRSCRMGMVIVT